MVKSNLQYLPFDRQAMEGTFAEWKAESPTLKVLALLPEAEAARLPELQEACRSSGGTLIGGIFPALIAQARFCTEGVWLLRLDANASTFLLPDVNEGEQEAAEKIALAVEAQLDAHAAGDSKPTLYLIFDALVPNIASILDGLYLRLADRVNYAGASAGSETFQPMPCLFDEGKVAGQGVAAILLPDAAATALEHGYRAPDRVMTATATVNNQIVTIDWRPAFDVYREVIRNEYGVELTRDNFYQYGVHFPFGIPRANEELIIRIPVALSEDGALTCIGEVPENSMLVLLQSPSVDAGCIEKLASSLASANGSMQGGELLAFYCAGRRLHLGKDAEVELARLGALTGATRIGGALSLGEVGSTQKWGYPLFHNATLVCTPWRQM